ncbi:hypothetical protein ACKKBF_B21300 [Auxenochlorella protothecoides x Auxenochlorella symbiontica]
MNALILHGRSKRRTLLASLTRHLARSLTSGPLPTQPPAISKLLVANRGEIACRVLTSARKLGIPSVAVYSEADRAAKHVSLADEAFCIGPAPARDSYLRTDRILEVAQLTGTTAVHPGYGFLSENTDFAAALEGAGVAFVGPPASAIRSMGNKSEAKALMSAAGVPVVPGYHGADQANERLQAEADRIGYPVLVKAVLGGGGKGMKLAASRAEFMDALNSARREALAGFGDDRVLLERYVQRPRHVEVQVMADAHGAAVYLFERDCSVQRRHQKVIEEAPAPGISESFRRSIGESATAAATAVGYRNAGTVEFIMDTATGEYFFMEMNTRLQVEHPVSEAISGVDLVEWQLRVAAGERLPLTQDQLRIGGHAFEARIYAENPANNFLPAGGRLLRWRPPPGAAEFGPGAVRVDSGINQGDQVGVHYDPMIAKLIVHGPTREAALRTLHAALGETQVAGLPTNIEFMRRVTQDPDFQTGGVDTSFIAEHEDSLLERVAPGTDELCLAALIYAAPHASGEPSASTKAPCPEPWRQPSAFRVNHPARASVGFGHAPATGGLELDLVGAGGGVTLEGAALAEGSGLGAEARVEARHVEVTADRVSAELAGRRVRGDYVMHVSGEEEVLDLWVGGRASQFRRTVVRRWERTGAASAGAAAGRIRSPMPGKVVKVFVSVGDWVEEGQPLVAVEAMKMEHAVCAPFSGNVAELAAHVGAQVDDGHQLALVEAAPAEATA